MRNIIVAMVAWRRAAKRLHALAKQFQVPPSALVLMPMSIALLLAIGWQTNWFDCGSLGAITQGRDLESLISDREGIVALLFPIGFCMFCIVVLLRRNGAGGGSS